MSDLISRQQAVDALGERPIVWTDDDQYTLGERCQYDIDRLAIETLPSVQPNLQNQLATDCISRQAAIEVFKKFIHEIGIEDAPYNYGEIALCEANVPSVEKVGKWVKAEKGGEWWYHCSICSSHIPKTLWGQDWHSSYCPNCGARMKGEEDDSM